MPRRLSQAARLCSGLVFGKTYVLFDWLEHTVLKDLGVDEVPNEQDFLGPQVIQKHMHLCSYASLAS